MSNGVNKVLLAGNIGKDPIMNHSEHGAIANVSLATSFYSKDGKQHTEWHRLVFFGKLAEVVQQYLKKGAKIFVEGSLRTRSWKDKDGETENKVTEIVCKELFMLDKKPVENQQSVYRPVCVDLDEGDVPF